MLIHLVIPTYHRPQKLKNCIDSILSSNPFGDYKIFVYFSDENDMEEFNYFLPNIITKKFIPKEKYSASKLWNDHILNNHNFDVMCYLSDDIIFEASCLKIAVDEMMKNFPDLDGVIGLRQKGFDSPTNTKTAFGLIGKKFVERFNMYEVFCPEYRRFFLDTELQMYLDFCGKFKYCKEAVLLHYHPALFPDQMDDTHKNGRSAVLKHDREIFEKRKSNGYLWGKNFYKTTWGSK